MHKLTRRVLAAAAVATIGLTAAPAIASATVRNCPSFLSPGAAYYIINDMSVRNMTCSAARTDINHAQYIPGAPTRLEGRIPGWHQETIHSYYLSHGFPRSQTLRYTQGAKAFRFTWAT